jgi:hypothetical protein
MPHDIIPEPIKGLPETPPPGEKILWQGAPTIWRAATGIYRFNWVMGWFALLAVWRGMVAETPADAVTAVTWSLLGGAIAAAILFTMAWATAKTTVYTITSRRVGMRIGVALTLTLNLPHQWIESADLRRRKNGTGDIALKMKGNTRLSFLVLWPHAQPWKLNPAVPMMRGLTEVDEVARILGDAATARIAEVGETSSGSFDTSDLPQGDYAPVPAE